MSQVLGEDIIEMLNKKKQTEKLAKEKEEKEEKEDLKQRSNFTQILPALGMIFFVVSA
jgi:hypothetical protein